MIFTLLLLGVLLVASVPVGMAFGLAGFQFAMANKIPPQTLASIPYEAVTSFPLLAIPLFLLMGDLMQQSNLAQQLFDAVSRFVGRLRYSVGYVVIGTCAFMGAITGSSVATVTAVGSIIKRPMLERGYPIGYIGALTASAGLLGVLIPPSIPLIIYGSTASVSVTELFLSSFVPGVLFVIVFGITHRFMAPRVLRGRGEAAERGFDGEATRGKHRWSESMPALLMPVIVLGGIYGGIFTPTEGAAIGSTLTFIIALLKRQMTMPKIIASIRTAAVTSGMIFMIFIGADMINAALALSQLPNQLAEVIANADIAPVVVMAAIMVFYIILGAVMDEMSMILLTVPVLFPVIMGLDFYGLNPSDKALWFGVLILTVCAIGMIFPPVGLNVYIMNGLAKDVPMIETYKGVTLFLAWDFMRLALLILFPGITLWLVRVLS